MNTLRPEKSSQRGCGRFDAKLWPRHIRGKRASSSSSKSTVLDMAEQLPLVDTSGKFEPHKQSERHSRPASVPELKPF